MDPDNPYNFRTQFRKWRDWNDDNLPKWHGHRYSKYNSDHTLKSSRETHLTNNNRQAILIKMLGMTPEERSLRNMIAFYKDDLLTAIENQHADKRPIITHLREQGFDIDSLRKQDIVYGSRYHLQFHPLVYKLLYPEPKEEIHIDDIRDLAIMTRAL